MFKIDRIKSFHSHTEIGVFDKLYEISQNLTVEQENQLCEWLSNNCEKNFIVTRTSKKIMAGGHLDNRKAWKKSRRSAAWNTYYVKLYKPDTIAFEFVWLTNEQLTCIN